MDDWFPDDPPPALPDDEPLLGPSYRLCWPVAFVSMYIYIIIILAFIIMKVEP